MSADEPVYGPGEARGITYRNSPADQEGAERPDPPCPDAAEWEDITREEAVEQYGEATIAALEAVLTINPDRAATLQGADGDLKVEFG